MLSGRVGPRDVRAAYGDPLIVGGTGGSGTRSIAQLLTRAGVAMGNRLNAEQDADRFVHFDWQHGRDLLSPVVDAPAEVGPDAGMSSHDRAFRRAVRAHLEGTGRPPQGQQWGWKHPHSYILLPFLRRQFPGLRFLHVVRDGRDMAFSDNQRQRGRYGPLLAPGAPDGPVGSAAYWSAANLYAAQGGVALGPAYHVVRLEDLCATPTETTFAMLRWAGLLPADAPVESAAWAGEIVRAPASLGRWRTSGAADLDAVAAAAGPGLAHFGYER